MEIKINAIGFSADKNLKSFIDEKVSKLSQFSDDILNAEVHLSLERSQTKNFDSKVSKIKILVPKSDFFAEKKAQSFEEAIDSSVSALKTQLIKHKEKKK